MKQWIALLIITIASFFIRFWLVDSLPVILNRDEAALGYNAKLLAETGKDEWGKSWPLALESFGDFKLPGYVWAIIPFLKLFGYDEWVVRLPSVLAGTLLIPVSFWAATTFGLKKPWNWLLTIFVATTPVLFFYSRIAFEANLALLLFVIALTLFFGEFKKPTTIWRDAIAVGLTLLAVFTYNTPLLLLPFVIVVLPWWRGFKTWQKWVPVAAALAGVAVIGGMQLLSLSERKSGITIFQDELTWLRSVEHYQKQSGPLKVVLGNRFVFFGSIIVQNYLKSFSPVFLLKTEGGHPWHSLPGSEHVLVTTYVLVLIGIASALVKHTKKTLLLVYLLLVSLLPAVITVDAPHATRSLLFFFLLNVCAVLGAKTVTNMLTKKIKDRVVIALGVLSLGLFSLYLSKYFTTFPQKQDSLKPGFEAVLRQVEAKYPADSIAVVDDEGFHYILTAWYLNMDPDTFFETSVRQLPDKIGFRYGERVGHYHFIAEDTDRVPAEKALIKWNEKLHQWQVIE